MSEKKYVPQGVFLVCDKGAKPSELKTLSYKETTLFGENMCTKVDKQLTVNFEPFGICSINGQPCTAPVTDWTNVTDVITLGGNELLLENSELPCTLGGTIKIFYSMQAAMGALPPQEEEDKGFWGTAWDFTKGVGKGLWKGAKGTVVGVYDLAVWAGKHSPTYMLLNPQGYAEQMQKDVETFKSIGNMAKKAGTWAYRNSPVNMMTNPADYMQAQQENAEMMDTLMQKASEMDAEEWGDFVGQVGFEVLMEVGTAGGAAALTTLKVADKTVDAARLINRLEDVVDAERALDKLDDVSDATKILDKIEDGTSLKSVPDEFGDVVNNKTLLDSEGDIGTYKELNDAGSVGDDITPHHMPSDAYMKKNGVEGYTRNDGLSMNMEQPHPGKGGRHRRTSTYDNNMTKAEQEAYWNKTPREALAHDIRDARRIYQEDGLYNEKIRENLREYLKQAKEKYPDIYNKPTP